jgi:predicted PurR-regulated permease PerM
LNPGRFYLFTLIVITGILAYLSYLIIKPFLTPLAWAVVMTVVFYPVYIYISRFIRWKSFASAITLLITIILIIGPFSYLLINLAAELRDFLHYLNTTGLPRIDELTKSEKVIWLQERIKDTFNIKDLDISSLVSNTLSKIGKAVLSNVTTGVANIASVVINFVLMLFAMFFMLKDGPGFIAKVKDYLPFSENQKDRLTSQMKDMVISTIYGGVVVALIQGVLGGVTFLLLGLQSPVLLGTAIALMSFIPAFGAFSVWGPVLVYLIIKKFYLKALILFLVGTFIISMVDNFLKPIIISGRTRMPTLFIFFSVIGGIRLFGLIGLVLGPLVIAMFISVVEIFRNLEGGGKDVES